MNIYKIYQTVNTGYDVYVLAIVIAEDEKQAKMMHPSDGRFYCLEVENRLYYDYQKFHSEWAYPDDVLVEYLGTASSDFIVPSVVCSDYIRG